MRQRLTFSFRQSLQSWLHRFGIGLVSGSAIATCTAIPGLAADSIRVEFGPLQTDVYISDLEAFAQTGAIPDRLKRYRLLLTPTVQQSLRNHLNVEPEIRDRFIEDLTKTKRGQPVTTLLADVAPDITPAMIQDAMQTAEVRGSKVTAISLLQALPNDTLTIKGGALLRLLSQLGLSRLEQMALSQVLYQELSANASTMLSTQFEPSIPGSQDYQRWSVSFRDHQRNRVIPIDLYWAETNPGPMVVLSHGFGADRHFLDYLAHHLASHGVTVVALEHPGSNVEALIRDHGTLLPAEEFVERPRDVSFILDRLEDLNQHSFFLRDRLSMNDITLIGHSLGGYTGLVLAGGKMNPIALTDFCAGLDVAASSPADWFQCSAADAKLPPESLTDGRISRLVLMNPLAGYIFGSDGLRQVKVPSLVITSTNDGIASVSDQQLRPFNQLSGPRSLIAIIGGTHLSVGDPRNINPALTQVPFMPEHPADETLQLRQYLKGTVLSFVMQKTPEAERYRPFLSADYAQLFSTQALPIRYSDRLPSSVNRWLINRDRLTHRLTPALKSIASLMHLELIGAQHRLAHLRRDTVAHIPIRPIDLANRIAPRPTSLYHTANQQLTHESSHPAE